MPCDSVVTAFPADTSGAIADSLIRYAMHYKGTPYKLGAVGPKQFDCSSFVRHVYAGVGIEIPRYTWTQIKVGREIRRVTDLQRGWIASSNINRIKTEENHVINTEIFGILGDYHKGFLSDLNHWAKAAMPSWRVVVG